MASFSAMGKRETWYAIGFVSDKLMRALREQARVERLGKIPGQPLSHPGELDAATPNDGTGRSEVGAPGLANSAPTQAASVVDPQGKGAGGTLGVKIGAEEPDPVLPS